MEKVTKNQKRKIYLLFIPPPKPSALSGARLQTQMLNRLEAKFSFLYPKSKSLCGTADSAGERIRPMLWMAKPPDFWYFVRAGFFFTDFFALRGGTCLIGARLQVDRGLQFDRLY